MFEIGENFRYDEKVKITGLFIFRFRRIIFLFLAKSCIVILFFSYRNRIIIRLLPNIFFFLKASRIILWIFRNKDGFRFLFSTNFKSSHFVILLEIFTNRNLFWILNYYNIWKNVSSNIRPYTKILFTFSKFQNLIFFKFHPRMDKIFI